MAYAMIGVPLMLMCLSNLGRVLAESVRQTYARLCIRQKLPHRYAAEGDDEHDEYIERQQYQMVPEKNEVNKLRSLVKSTELKILLFCVFLAQNLQECNLCQYNVCKETRTCNSNERSGKQC